jgi:hypothetical protein
VRRFSQADQTHSVIKSLSVSFKILIRLLTQPNNSFTLQFLSPYAVTNQPRVLNRVNLMLLIGLKQSSIA